MTVSRGYLVLEVAGAPSPERIIAAAAVAFDVSVAELTGDSRAAPLVTFRQVAMAATRKGGHSFPVIGDAFHRDHTTVMSACRRVQANQQLRTARDRLYSDLLDEFLAEVSR